MALNLSILMWRYKHLGHAANECGTGAINAAAEVGIYAIGDSYDQYTLAPYHEMESSIPDDVKQLMENE